MTAAAEIEETGSFLCGAAGLCGQRSTVCFDNPTGLLNGHLAIVAGARSI